MEWWSIGGVGEPKIRRPKAEIRKKTEIRNPKRRKARAIVAERAHCKALRDNGLDTMLLLKMGTIDNLMTMSYDCRSMNALRMTRREPEIRNRASAQAPRSLRPSRLCGLIGRDGFAGRLLLPQRRDERREPADFSDYDPRASTTKVKRSQG
jgi:hypothetical protein